ncbi:MULTISPECIES: hypothetical protein [unclassified Vibrio]|uniref:Phage holin family protein n=1 Tax=Vibrio sp. HB236076 TaxID=3232307 RepID=A0AB39HF91_9VIBR|nr:hypothetical protein [Vibrio sp. HB161653]MDP5255118.1 hypothetical protein [Vibrio sp. HB161653]
MKEKPDHDRATEDSGSAEQSELQELLNLCLALLSSIDDSKRKTLRWLTHTRSLFFLELNTAVIALQRKLFIALLVFFLTIIFIVGICVLIGAVFYQWFPSLPLSALVSVMCLGMFIISSVCYFRYLDRFMAFNNTREQIKQGVDIVSKRQSESD